MAPVAIQAELRPSGFHIECITQQELLDIRKYFTLSTKTINGIFKSQLTFTSRHNQLVIPRFGLFSFLKTRPHLQVNITNKLVAPSTTAFKKEDTAEWRAEYTHNQQVLAAHIMKRYYTAINISIGKAGLIVKMEPGQGKTFLAMGLLAQLRVKALVIVHNKTVMYDWHKELTRCFPNAKIGTRCGARKQDGDIVVAIINSVLTSTMAYTGRNTTSELSAYKFFKQFGLIIYDEIHEYCSKKRRAIFQRAQAPYMLGLSATPDERLDGLNPVSFWGCGPVLDAAKVRGFQSNQAGAQFSGAVRCIQYHGCPDYNYPIINDSTGLISTPLMINNLVQDPYRLQLVCDEIKRLMQKRHYIFVFADRRKYLYDIKALLNSRNQIQSNVVVDISTLLGGSTTDEIKHAEDSAQVILTTYQFMSTGKSIPKMDALLLATPRKSKSRQTIGRIFRLGSNMDIERQIVDIVDWDTIFKRQWYERVRFYKEKAFTIDKQPVHWDKC